MGDLRYTVEYDHRVGLYRWQIVPGQQLLPWPVATARCAPRVVALGGGTGLPILLRGLKAAMFPPGEPWTSARDRDRLTAIVPPRSNGSSGADVRRADQGLGADDFRNALLALSDGEAAGPWCHEDREGEGKSSAAAVVGARGGESLAIPGQVLPCALDAVVLRTNLEDGRRRLLLEPEGVGVLPQAVDAIEAADLIVIGPGKLYASLIAILVMKEIAATIGRAHAPVVLVMNLMTELGETDGYTATDHVLAIGRHAPEIPIHGVLFNTAPIPSEMVERYAVEGRTPVRVEVESLRAQSHRLVGRDLLGSDPLVRHDPRKLARAVLDFASDVGGAAGASR